MAIIATILESCEALVTNLRTDRKRVAVDFVAVDIVDIVLSTVAIARSGFGPHSDARAVEVRLPSNLPLVAGRPPELRQVLLNLLLNAFDASPSRLPVRVTGHVEDGTVVLRVDDKGQGIPTDHLDRIFAPYFTTKGRQGSGLGLAVARDIITRHGGSIRAFNAPHRGARFEIRLRPWLVNGVVVGRGRDGQT